MPKMYSINEFHSFLKLGIWESGMVSFWGQVDNLQAWDDFLFPENLKARYNSSSLIKRHLDIGLYLLDIFHISQDTRMQSNVYHAVIAICRNDMEHLESLRIIRVTNRLSVRDFYSALTNAGVPLDSSSRGGFSLLNRRSAASLSNNIPIGSRYIQHQ